MPALENYTFNVGVVNNNNFLVGKLADGKWIGVSGPYFAIFQTLVSALGFKYRLILADDVFNTEWNRKSNRSSLNGMIMRNEIDFAGYFIGINYERHNYHSFSPECFRISLTYLTKKSPVFPVKLDNIFIDSFQYSLWLSILLIVLIFPFFLRTIRCLKYRSKKKPPAVHWEIASLVMGNSSLDDTRRDALTILAITPLMILIGCTLTFYCSTISASVTSKESTKPINTVKELIHAVHYRNFKIGLPRMSKVHKNTFIKMVSNQGFLRLAELLKNPSKTYFFNEAQAWEAICNSNVAFITNMNHFLLYKNSENYSSEEIHEAKEPLIKWTVAMPYARSFIHHQIFTETYLRIISSGIIDKLTGIKRDDVRERKTNDLVFIDMIDLNIIFQTLLLAHLFVGIVLVVEILFNYRI